MVVLKNSRQAIWRILRKECATVCCFPEFSELLFSKIPLTWHLCFIQKLHAFFLQRFKYFLSITLGIFFKKLQSSSKYVRQWTKYFFVTILFHSSGIETWFSNKFQTWFLDWMYSVFTKKNNGKEGKWNHKVKPRVIV